MRRIKPTIWMLFVVISASLAGCYGVSGGYSDEPEWDGGVYVGGLYGRGGYDRDHGWHDNAFRGDGRHAAGAVSDRGHASLGGFGGAGHAGAGGGRGGGGGGGHR